MSETSDSLDLDAIRKGRWLALFFNLGWIGYPAWLLIDHSCSDEPSVVVRNLITVFGVFWFLGGLADVFFWKILKQFSRSWLQVSWKPHVFLGVIPVVLAGALGMWLEFAFYLIGYLCTAIVRKAIHELVEEAGVKI